MKYPENLRELLCLSEEKYRERSAFILKDKDGKKEIITYEKLKKDAEAFGTALIYETGMKNKKIALMAENSYKWCLSYLSITGGVGTVMPVDRELPIQELYNILSFSQTECIICDKKVYEEIYPLSKDGKLKIICTQQVEGALFIDDLIRRGEILLEQGKMGYMASEPDGEKTAVLLFTSGTTGMPKGVMLSHRNLCSDLAAVSKSIQVSADEVSLSALPLHHTYEAIAFLIMICSGGTITFLSSVRNIREDFAFYRPTVFVTVPLMLEKLHRHIMRGIEKQGKRNKLRFFSMISAAVPEEKKRKMFSDIHSFFGGRLTKIIVGAAALQKEIAEDFSAFGIPVIIGYGLTECSPIVICNTPDSLTCDSVGKAIDGVEVKIINPDEKGIGEICVKGPMVMSGYYKNRIATDEVLIDGFLHTGDLGYRDRNGNYHITGRKKNVIVTKNGKNIYPEEIEYYLLRSGAVSDAMVYAQDDSILSVQIIPDTEEICRRLKKREVTEEEIRKAVTEAVRSINRRLPSYKNIKKVNIRSKDFVRTSTKKIRREEKENRE